MKPVIALIGRPNVGKSTLFNRLTRSRTAIVEDIPGVTRDVLYGVGRIGDRDYMVVDTGGIEIEENRDAFKRLIRKQVEQVVEDCDALVLVTDGRAGVTHEDREIVESLRSSDKAVWLAVNKSEGVDEAIISAEFHQLGLPNIVAISALHGDGTRRMCDQILAGFPQVDTDIDDAATGIRISVIGRPNVGKSTLINTLLGEERVVVFDQPGTTRDSVHVPFVRDNENYVLIDTACLRRKSRIKERLERFSVIRTVQSLEASHVTILVLDAKSGVTDQDATIAGLVLNSGNSVIIAVNKWDGLARHQRTQVKRDLERKLGFLFHEEALFISALHGSGLGELWQAVQDAYQAAMVSVGTGALNRALADAVEAQAPPLVGHRRIKLKYIHQGGKNPPRFILHGNQTGKLPANYRRYLSNYFRRRFQLFGTQVVLEFKQAENPYEGRVQKRGRRR